jgi:pimeloyl-ACP methyl ester carboxylesterase
MTDLSDRRLIAGSAATAATPWRPALALRQQSPDAAARRRPVLYIHGFTFASDLSVFWRIDGRSWADAMNDAGFAVWGLDFAGFGDSERYPEMMAEQAPASPPLGSAFEAQEQVERAVQYILSETGAPTVSIVAHSRGAIVAGVFAANHPGLVERLALFGPLAERRLAAPPFGLPAVDRLPPWRLVTAKDQRERFIEDVPKGHRPVLAERHFAAWARAYLASDAASASRDPPSVKVPNGPLADVVEAWRGRLAYDPAGLRCLLLIARGAWDSLTTDADAAWLIQASANAPFRRDVKLGEGTHLMLFEEGRFRLQRVVNLFLRGELP